MEQEKAIELALEGHNIFLTGKAGTGKTYTLNKIIEELENEGKVVAKTASTGIASTHLNGQTVHAWSGTGIKEALIEDDLYKIKKNPFAKARILNTEVLIIDEISMLKGIKFDVINQMCQFIHKNKKPFGGIQVIICGDFFQLPPVERGRTTEKDYCFKSKSWKDAEFKVCYLQKIYRQVDPVFVGLLNNIRQNSIMAQDHEVLKSLLSNKNDEGTTNLYCKNIDVDIINTQKLNEIKKENVFFRMESSGNEFAVEKLKKNCLAPSTLIIKEGAKVMFLKNEFDRDIVNGTQGEVDHFDGYEQRNKKDEIINTWECIPFIKILKTGKILPAIPATWEMEEYNPSSKKNEVIASITQIPLKLSWALTIHKSQGATFDFINLDLGDVFEFGMGYVALSRATSLGGIYLSRYNSVALQVCNEVIEKDKEFLRQSEELC